MFLLPFYSEECIFQPTHQLAWQQCVPLIAPLVLGYWKGEKRGSVMGCIMLDSVQEKNQSATCLEAEGQQDLVEKSYCFTARSARFLEAKREFSSKPIKYHSSTRYKIPIMNCQLSHISGAHIEQCTHTCRICVHVPHIWMSYEYGNYLYISQVANNYDCYPNE